MNIQACGLFLVSTVVVSVCHPETTQVIDRNQAELTVSASGVENARESAAKIAPTANKRMYSADEIVAMFQRPRDARQLLQNLKLALDKDLLVQPVFFDDSLLMKFFNVRKIYWGSTAENETRKKYWHGIAVSPSRNELWTSGYQITPSRYIPSHIANSGYIDIRVGRDSGFTVGLIREVFGQDLKEEMDTGFSTDGGSHPATTKGWVTYEDSAKELASGQIAKSRVTFEIRKDDVEQPRQAGSDPNRRKRFRDDEMIERIYISEVER